METKIADSLRRRWTDGGDFRAADFTRVVIQFVKNFEKGVHAVRTGEHDPVIAVRVLNEFREFA